MNRAHACEYDENLQKSQTQMLTEQLAALEKRLQELESPSRTSIFPCTRFKPEPSVFKPVMIQYRGHLKI
jgi:hypothetical protein